MQTLSRHGIGGSEAASVLGLNPYQPPIALWQRKRAELAGEVEPVVDTAPIRWGRLLEEPIRQAYAERFDVKVFVPGESMFHGEHSWRRATPDGLILDEVGPVYGLEIKTASARLEHQWGDDGSDDVPPHYAVQCLWYCHVLDIDRWDLAALIGGQDFRCYTLRRDRDLEHDMVDQVSRFWHDNVLGGAEPAVDGSEDFRRYLIDKWPGQGGTLKADARLEALLMRIATLRGNTKRAEDELRLAENELRVALGDETVLESSVGRVICRPRQGRTIVDWEAVAGEFATGEILAAMARKYTTRAKPSRPLLYPRAMSALGDSETNTNE